MSDLNLSQIQTRLNELFVTYGERKLIFWFDPKKEFEEDIDNGQIVLNGAQIYKLAPDNQFETKRFFELEDKDNSYLIYAPFERMSDDDENNFLLSLLKYSGTFNADRISLIMTQLNIPAELHAVMETYAKFFGAKSRVASFEKMMTGEIKSREELEMTLMAVLTRANTAQLYSVIQALFVEYSADLSDSYDQLVRFDLAPAFWQYVAHYYGYTTTEPTIQSLVIAFFANTYFGQLGYQELPIGLKDYEVLDQTMAIVSFMDGVMNDSRYSEPIDRLSADIYRLINGDKLLDKAPIEELIDADVFEAIHSKIIEYYIAQLTSDDLTPLINGMSLEEIVVRKQRAHFGFRYEHQYQAILNAQKLLNSVTIFNMNRFSELVKDYEDELYLIDQYYRKFTLHLDQIDEHANFASLQNVVEKHYKQFLDEIGRTWNELFSLDERPSVLDFYDNYAKSKTKTVVIISDALRYEIAKEIQQSVENEKKFSTKMTTIFSVLPSVTEFGKAASLRSGQESYEYLSGNDVHVNGLPTQGTKARDKVLKVKNPNALAITYSDVVDRSNAKELRDLFNGKEIIYLYHDQIDRTGDHGQEMQVFDAAERTVKELKAVIPYIANGANVQRFVITGDHGFIYTRSAIEEYEKIENPSNLENDRVERRFIISDHQYDEIGIKSMRLGTALRNNDQRYIHFSETSTIFKKAGGGQNYSHGGSSPQEMMIPVLEVNVARGSAQKEPVSVRLMTAKRKVVGLSISLEFYQTEAISDSITKAQYALYFEDKHGVRISNENTYYADSTAGASSERFTNFAFEFVNRNYETNEDIYLVIKNEETKVELDRVDFVIDNPFAGGFGFDI